MYLLAWMSFVLIHHFLSHSFADTIISILELIAAYFARISFKKIHLELQRIDPNFRSQP